MPDENFLSGDSTKEAAKLPNSLRSPILWSTKAVEDSIRLEHHNHPARGTNECCLSLYTISVHVGRPIQLEQAVDGRLLKEYMGYGDIIISPPNLHRKLRWDHESELVLLYLEPRFFSDAINKATDAESVEIVPQFKLRDPLIQNLLLSLKSELATGGLDNNLYAESMATALSVHLFQKYSTFTSRLPNYAGGLSKHRLRRAIEYINANLDKDLRLSAIANAAGMSQYHFARLFKQSMGLPVYQYVIHHRIERAQQLLKHENLAIADVALAVGFGNQSQFARHFKRIVGITPKEFRRQ
jgi:AraC family transcriptional regulator